MEKEKEVENELLKSKPCLCVLSWLRDKAVHWKVIAEKQANLF